MQKKNNQKEDPMVQVSKKLSYILRHGAEKEGVPIRNDGFVKISDIQKWKQLKGVKLNDIHQVVAENNKKRFEVQLIEVDGQAEEYIRAVQGHTISEIKDELLLDKITDAQQYPLIVHGTYFKSWDLIKQSGLKTMGRNHIHFAIGMPGELQVISGMRNTCQVYIEVDLKKAMQAGIEFFVSKNNVVLSSGIDGVISPNYFKIVKDLKGQVLFENKELQQQQQILNDEQLQEQQSQFQNY